MTFEPPANGEAEKPNAYSKRAAFWRRLGCICYVFHSYASPVNTMPSNSPLPIFISVITPSALEI